MSIDELQELILNIQFQEQLISTNTNNELQIAQAIEKHFFAQDDVSIKIAIFLLVSQLLSYASLSHNKQFLKNLSPKIIPFIKNLQEDLLNNFKLASVLEEQIEKWASEDIFAISFLDRIQQVANPILSSIRAQFTKYQKSFLIDLTQIRKIQFISAIYDTIAAMTQVNSQISYFQQAFFKINFFDPKKSEKSQVADLLKDEAKLQERLQIVTSILHQLMKALGDEVNDSFKSLQAQ